MRLVGSRLVLQGAAPQSPADTTHMEANGWVGHHRRGGRGIVGGVICLAVVVYVLWLATRVVRAVEKIADKSHGEAA